jgi:putative ATPase
MAPTDLFHSSENSGQPLAARMRPQSLEDYVGQQHILGSGKALRNSLEKGQLHSMILWGPPGVGKTTLANIIAHSVDADFESLSAILSGVKDIRAAVDRAKHRRQMESRATVLFVDEVHRFNKAQQDAFLPFVEDGTVTFIGATTENPSFEVNNALMSRCRVYVLQKLDSEDLNALLSAALQQERGLGARNLALDQEQAEQLLIMADGDARRLLNLLEVASDLVEDGQKIGEQVLEQVFSTELRRFDKGGDLFYEQISALHKSVRGSDPDASLYWFCRMLDGGCDPLYIARRVVRMASEDIGNADPRALPLALNAWDVQERLGEPEGELAIAQALVYLACAPKSNAVYKAFKSARVQIAGQASYEVPVHLRNAPTKLMKGMGYGQEYRYAHDEPEAFAAGENYFPPELGEQRYYDPVERGLEIKIAEKLKRLRELNRAARQKQGTSS